MSEPMPSPTKFEAVAIVEARDLSFSSINSASQAVPVVLLDLVLGDVSKYLPDREKMLEQQVGFYYLWK